MDKQLAPDYNNEDEVIESIRTDLEENMHANKIQSLKACHTVLDIVKASRENKLNDEATDEMKK